MGSEAGPEAGLEAGSVGTNTSGRGGGGGMGGRGGFWGVWGFEGLAGGRFGGLRPRNEGSPWGSRVPVRAKGRDMEIPLLMMRSGSRVRSVTCGVRGQGCVSTCGPRHGLGNTPPASVAARAC